jgi:hypothetical protein
MTLEKIRNKNKKKNLLLDIEEINNQEYSEELVEQCKEEFEMFVKPIGYKTLQRYLENNSKEAIDNKYNK